LGDFWLNVGRFFHFWSHWPTQGYENIDRAFLQKTAPKGSAKNVGKAWKTISIIRSVPGLLLSPGVDGDDGEHQNERCEDRGPHVQFRRKTFLQGAPTQKTTT
jgi:hypothetical protein